MCSVCHARTDCKRERAVAWVPIGARPRPTVRQKANKGRGVGAWVSLRVSKMDQGYLLNIGLCSRFTFGRAIFVAVLLACRVKLSSGQWCGGGYSYGITGAYSCEIVFFADSFAVSNHFLIQATVTIILEEEEEEEGGFR